MANVRELHVNGSRRALDADADRALLSVLRDDLDLTGSKYVCGEGRCGACTVLVDDRPVVACLYPVALADGVSVRTAAGLAPPDGELTALQQALLDRGGLQCGACTPGVLMTLTALLERNPAPDEAEVREALAGNVCRCTGYEGIVAAALECAAAP